MQISFVVPTGSGSVHVCRQALVHIIGAAGQTGGEDAELVVAELVATALNNAHGPLTFSLRQRGDHIRVGVADMGETEVTAHRNDRLLPLKGGTSRVSALSCAWGTGCGELGGSANVWAVVPFRSERACPSPLSPATQMSHAALLC